MEPMALDEVVIRDMNCQPVAWQLLRLNPAIRVSSNIDRAALAEFSTAAKLGLSRLSPQWPESPNPFGTAKSEAVVKRALPARSREGCDVATCRHEWTRAAVRGHR